MRVPDDTVSGRVRLRELPIPILNPNPNPNARVPDDTVRTSGASRCVLTSSSSSRRLCSARPYLSGTNPNPKPNPIPNPSGTNPNPNPNPIPNPWGTPSLTLTLSLTPRV